MESLNRSRKFNISCRTFSYGSSSMILPMKLIIDLHSSNVSQDRAQRYRSPSTFLSFQVNNFYTSIPFYLISNSKMSSNFLFPFSLKLKFNSFSSFFSLILINSPIAPTNKGIKTVSSCSLPQSSP